MRILARFFAIMLCVVLPLPALSAENLLTNGSFDEPTDQGPASGWHLSADVGNAPTVTRMSEEGASGGAFVRLSRTSDGQSDLRPVTGSVAIDGNMSYLLTARLRVSNARPGSHSAELQWFGNGRYLGRATAAATVADKWVHVAAGPVTPPEGCTRAIVLLRCYQSGTYDFDDVGLWPVQIAGENLLKNSGFESDGDGNELPDDWTASGETATWDAETAATGSRSAKLTRQGNSDQAAWRQDNVPVEPGRKCELSAAVHCDVFGRDFSLAVEWTAGGKIINTDTLSDQTFTNWQRKSLRSVVPPGADRASVVVELLSEGTLWLDDVALVQEDMVAEVELSILKPNARGMVRQGIDKPVLQAMCCVQSSLDDVSCRVVLLDAAQREVATAEPGKDGSLEFPLDQLRVGSYTLTARVSSGGKVVASDTAFLDIVRPSEPGVFFRDDHIAVVDGVPWFPIGVTSISPSAEEAQRLAAAGFNLLVPNISSTKDKQTVQACLDRAEELGLYVMEWNNAWVYASGESAREVREQALQTMAANVADHPAFLGIMCDEALWNGVPLSDVTHAYATMRRLMPTHLFWQNQAPRNSIEDLARYCRAADVTGMDIYPVEGATHSDLPNKTLSVVGDEVDKNRQTVDDRKPVWAILQGFGWNAWEKDASLHKRAPTWVETRFMAYDAILHGASGIVYWGASYEDRQSDIWNSLRRIASELKDLTPALVSREVVEINAESADGAVIATGRRVDGKLWILAVNERDTQVEATLHLPDAVESLQRWQEDGDGPELRDNELVDSFGPYEVHVYREK